MNESQFWFLVSDFEEISADALKAEKYARRDPRTSIFYARRTVELALVWAFKHDRQLTLPYDQNLNAYVNEPTFAAIAGGNPAKIARKIQKAGNRAVHDAKPPSVLDAVQIVSALYTFSVWLGITYGTTTKPDHTVGFKPTLLPQAEDKQATSTKDLLELETKLDEAAEATAQARSRAANLSKSNEELAAEVATLIELVAQSKKAAEATPIPEENWSEAETRKYLVDEYLLEAGWRDLVDGKDLEYQVDGMPNKSGTGFVDYVLWGDDGKPLAVVEAKRATKDANIGQQQATLYADCLESESGQRPVIFYTNGYEHWIWDDYKGLGNHAPRQIQGFYTKDQLALLIQRRTTAVPTATIDINKAIVDRPYQHRAIRAITENFEVAAHRKALVVMATGAGKTRTVIALTDVLLRANWAKRVLFLADRTALVNQAVNSFKANLPDSNPVNLVTEPNEDGRVCVSTYQTMMGKINEERQDGTRRFGVGHFDLIIIDEAHRSVYSKYRAIFEYFDSLLVGLTATPKDEVNKNTYGLFDLETGVPTDSYSLEEAIEDGHLVPAVPYSIPLGFMRQGIRYDDLSDEERAKWDESDWGEDEFGDELDPPDSIDAAALNKWLFNIDTVDKALEHLMVNGIKVAGGDRLGKTIVFAKNQAHAQFIYERFNANYPHLDGGSFARVITHQTKYAQSLIDDFSIKDKSPTIAISVDMLDTGIDVPECVNLVFFKPIRSKTKFWQMVGRGTRKCEDLFGPGMDKDSFRIFDFCLNLEYFSQPIVPADNSDGMSIGKRIFRARLELVSAFEDSGTYPAERKTITELLRESIESMNQANFLVRPHLQLVQKFSTQEAWDTASIGDLAELADHVSGLPDQLPPTPEEAKRFDVLLLKAQLGLLSGDAIENERGRVVAIASLLEDNQTIPAIKSELELILDVQTDEWWVDVTYPMLEQVRDRLRMLVSLIVKSERQVLYSDFEDTIGEAVAVELPNAGTTDYLQFRKKVEHFVKENLGQATVAKVRSGEPLTSADIVDLQRILVAAGVGGDDDFETASEKAGDFGLFIRSIAGLSRAVAAAAFADFMDEKRYSKNQIEFIGMIISYLTEHGTVRPARIYESPFSSVAPTGVEGLFTDEDVESIFATIERFYDSADTGSAETEV